jgi:short-subunit dehydrogenase
MRISRALITGASSGIGAEFARQLARSGSSLLLVARRKDKLEEVIGELRKHYNVEAEYVAADLATEEGIVAVAQAIEAHPDIDLLINNAGFGVSGDFHSGDINRQMDMLRVHIEAVNRLTHAVLPRMTSSKHGAIINVASIAGFGPSPGSVNYNATKAYLIRFSESLAVELAPYSIRVQAFCPGFTHTPFHFTPELKGKFRKDRLPGFLWNPVGPVVAHSLRSLEKNRTVVVPYWKNRLMTFLMRSKLYFLLLRFLSRHRLAPIIDA